MSSKSAPRDKRDTRARILAAAEELARSAGPGNLSLEAVAAAAGISKGGLLYHFPSKSSLLRALVEDFLKRMDVALSAAEADRPNALIAVYLDYFLRKRRTESASPCGLLAALMDDPGLLDPVRAYERDFLDRIRSNARDPNMATVAFLVLHGIRSMELLNVQVVSDEEIADVIDWLKRQSSPTS